MAAAKINYTILPNSMVINSEGKNWNIHKSDARFDVVLKAIKEQRLDDVLSLLDVKKLYEVAGLKVKDNELWLDGVQLHGVIADRIIKFRLQGLPFEPLVKFARKLRNNPSFNSREQLYKFLEHNGHPITSEGNFIAYRGVREDFKDVHTGKFDNSVGSSCVMPRSEVDDNPNNTCSNGFHVACYEYAKGFGEVLVEVEVNPCDVVCVPVDYNGTKMRVCAFKVVSLCQGLNENQLVESKCDTAEVIYEDDCFDSDEVLEKEVTEVITEESSQSDDFVPLYLKSSQVIYQAQYNPKTKILRVRLNNGITYYYEDVPSIVITDWENSVSVGAFYNKNIAYCFKFASVAVY